MDKELFNVTVPTSYLVAVILLLCSSVFWWLYFYTKRETGRSSLWIAWLGLLTIGWAVVFIYTETIHRFG